MVYRTSTTPQGACPRCIEPLQAHPTLSDLQLCKRCGGIFANVAASRRIVMTLDRAMLEAGFEASRGKERRDNRMPVTCPECLIEMVKTPITSAVCEVDACAEHGTWFDTGELVDVMRAYANFRKRGGRVPTAPPPDPNENPFHKSEGGRSSMLDLLLDDIFGK